MTAETFLNSSKETERLRQDVIDKAIDYVNFMRSDYQWPNNFSRVRQELYDAVNALKEHERNTG